MPANRIRIRRTTAPGPVHGPAQEQPAAEPGPESPDAAATRRSWRQAAMRPSMWLAAILVAAAGATFQDVLTQTARTVLSLDDLPDQLSPQNAVTVVEVRDMTDTGRFLVRGEVDRQFTTTLGTDRSWGKRPDVVAVGRAEWLISLRGRAGQQVRITDLVPEIEGGSCEPALSGSLVVAPGQGSADVTPLHVAIDAPVPQMTVPSEDGGAEQPYFTGPKPKHITLDRNETEAFLITADARNGYCRWHYRLHYEVNGSMAEMVLNGPNDKPFELTAELADATGYRTVFFPAFLCSVGGYNPRTWYAATGAEYRASQSEQGARVPCPGTAPQP